VAPIGSTVVHGVSWGADEIADEVARALGLETDPFPADWLTYKRAAGPIRNSAMVASGADVCLAFSHEPDMGGTGDCTKKARRAGIPVFTHPIRPDWPEDLDTHRGSVSR
jgi:hypothetical protein